MTYYLAICYKSSGLFVTVWRLLRCVQNAYAMLTKCPPNAAFQVVLLGLSGQKLGLTIALGQEIATQECCTASEVDR